MLRLFRSWNNNIRPGCSNFLEYKGKWWCSNW